MRRRIIFYWKSKETYKRIQELLLQENKKFKTSVNTICQVVKRFKNEQRLTDLPRTGRHPKLRKKHLEYLNELISNDREITNIEISNKIRDKYRVIVSPGCIRLSAKKIQWSRKQTRYCQIVSEINKLKRKMYANFCHLTNESFDDCIFIDEAIIEMNVYAPTRWIKKGNRNYRVGRPKHPLKVINKKTFNYLISSLLNL